VAASGTRGFRSAVVAPLIAASMMTGVVIGESYRAGPSRASVL